MAAGKAVLVTGAGGFVGANLVRRLLRDGHKPHAVVRPGSDTWRLEGAEARVHVADLTDPHACRSLVEDVRPDWVFHLAAHGAYSWQTDVERIFATNLGATVALAEACVRLGCDALIHAGSSSEYGYRDHPPSEEELPEPNSHYAVGKAAATLYCAFLAREHGLNAVSLRLYSAYGPWEEPGRLMPTLASRGLSGELPPLVNPDTARDFVYVDDVCDAFVLAAESRQPRPGAVYNIGSGVQTTLREIVELARRRLGIEAAPEWGSMPAREWDTGVWISDPRRAREELGWTPRHDLEDGFGGLVDWLCSEEAPADRY